MATLETLLAPVPLPVFFERYWTKQFLHVPGASDKFTDLYGWDPLNRALNELRFGPNRLGMMKAGQPLDYGRYLTAINGQVNQTRLMHEFARGATLILNHGEENHPPLRGLCVALDRLFHTDVTVNVYAACGHDNGFGVHWDEQDTLIVQVSGRKHWKVWPPTRRDPFKQDVVDTSNSTRPTGRPLWDGILEQGSLLSVPRGWWHVVYPIGTPSLHLTVTIKSLTGIDMLHWIADQMKGSAAARMSIPVTNDHEAGQAWLNEIWRNLSETWGDDLVSRYLDERDRDRRLRPALRLPAGFADDKETGEGITQHLHDSRAHTMHAAERGAGIFVRLNRSWTAVTQLWRSYP